MTTTNATGSKLDETVPPVESDEQGEDQNQQNQGHNHDVVAQCSSGCPKFPVN